MEHNFLQALHSGRVPLMEGAMGTELQRAGVLEGACYEQCNLTHPERVLAVHRAYTHAGAEVLVTNTFQANPAALAKHQADKELETICASGVRLARQAAAGRGFVLASIGPWQGSGDDLARMVADLAEADGLLFETLSDLGPLQLWTKLGRREPNPAVHPVLISCTYQHSAAGALQTFTGLQPEAIAQEAVRLGAAAIGVNCGSEIAMDDVIEIIRRYRTVTDLPLFARPNAGTPRRVDGQWVYPRSPEDMATKLPGLLEAGVTMVGGCCGTTPAHIAAFRQVIDASAFT